MIVGIGLKAPNLALFKEFLVLINFSYNPRGEGVTFMAKISKPIAWLSGAIPLSCIYIVPCQPFSALHPHLGHSWETFDASGKIVHRIWFGSDRLLWNKTFLSLFTPSQALDWSYMITTNFTSNSIGFLLKDGNTAVTYSYAIRIPQAVSLLLPLIAASKGMEDV